MTFEELIREVRINMYNGVCFTVANLTKNPGLRWTLTLPVTPWMIVINTLQEWERALQKREDAKKKDSSFIQLWFSPKVQTPLKW